MSFVLMSAIFLERSIAVKLISWQEVFPVRLFLLLGNSWDRKMIATCFLKQFAFCGKSNLRL